MSSIAGSLDREHWWLWLSTALLVLVVASLLALWWSLADMPAGRINPYLEFFDSLVGALALLIVGFATVASAYSARQSAEMVRLMVKHDADARLKDRQAAISAFVGAALETAGTAAWLAELQRFGLQGIRRWLPDSRAQVEFLVAVSRDLTRAASSVSKALEVVRYQEPDLSDWARPISVTASDCVRVAAEGDTEKLLILAQELCDSADELQARVAGRP